MHNNRALRVGMVLLVGATAFVSHAQNAPVSNVPDAVTRKTGLHVEPMARPARIYAEN